MMQSTGGTQKVRGFARYVPTVVRWLTGLWLFVFGLNGFLNFLPLPTVQLSEGAMAFSESLMKSGYMLPLIFATQLLVGALLLINRFVPLALVLLAPFIVNSMAFHIFLEHSGIPMASLLLVFEVVLVWHYRKAYASILTAQEKQQ